MKLQFVSSPLSPKFGDKEAAKVAEQLLRVEKQFGSITPKVLVSVAADPKNYLNKYFTWNDAIAADAYRMWEARKLIASVYVTTEDGDGEATVPVRAFVNIRMESEEEGEGIEPAYVSMKQTVNRQDYQSQVLQYANQQLKAWRQRFGNFKEFFSVVSEIDKL